MAFWAQAQAQAAKSRTKRAMKKPTKADLKKFVGEVSSFKSDMRGNFGNLTCVLAKIGQLDADLDIKLSYFTDKMWENGFAEGKLTYLIGKINTVYLLFFKGEFF